MKTKELREIEAEEMEQEPSLDKLVDLDNPEVLKGLGRMAARITARKAEQNSQSPQGSTSQPPERQA